MEWVLRILGVIGALFLIMIVLIVAVIFTFKRKLKKLAEQFGDLQYSAVPRRVTLVPVDSPEWKDADRAHEEIGALLGLGFEPVGSFTTEEMDYLRLQALVNPAESLYAVVYEHDKAGIWSDLVARYLDDTSLTLSNAKDGGQMDQRPGHGNVYDRGAPVDRLYQRMLQERPDRPLQSVSAAEFKAEFEKAYADEMDWRNSRGGATVDEIRAILAANGEEVDEEAIEQIRKTKEAEAYANLTESLRERFLEQTPLTAAEWERVRERLLFVHDGLSPAYAAELYLNAYPPLGDEDDEELYERESDRIAEMLRRAPTIRTGFSSLVSTVAEERRFEALGAVTGTVPADVYVQPELADDDDDDD